MRSTRRLNVATRPCVFRSVDLMPRKPNSESERPVLTLRVRPGTLARIDELAESSGRSRADVAGELLVGALNEESGTSLTHFSEEERATWRAAAQVRSRLMQAVRDELERMESEVTPET